MLLNRSDAFRREIPTGEILLKIDVSFYALHFPEFVMLDVLSLRLARKRSTQPHTAAAAG
jgi:hypothetical protein